MPIQQGQHERTATECRNNPTQLQEDNLQKEKELKNMQGSMGEPSKQMDSFKAKVNPEEPPDAKERPHSCPGLTTLAPSLATNQLGELRKQLLATTELKHVTRPRS